jgi:predicted outer membrane lipoprotein
VAKAAVNGLAKAASAILNPLWLDLSDQKDHLPLIGVNLSD